ncbi:MAG: hypothetical protein II821_09075 [Treponema sp.]|nr:hypothetical protein [Treponema sp.]
MKKKSSKLFLAGILMTVSVVFLSCCTTDILSAPYVISNPHVETGSIDEKYNYAGMHFSLFNDSEKTIRSFTISFMLYDSEGNNPFIGSNCIVSKCEEMIEAGAAGDFVISLDQYISVVPDEAYLTDFVYIREICYTDLSVWKDPYGMYCVREAYE